MKQIDSMSTNGPDSRVRYARLAGLMYLVVDAAYAAGMMLTRGLQAPGDFGQTAARVAGSEVLYRIGLTSTLIGALCTVLLAMGLYVLLKPVDANLALLALLFRLAEATVFGVQVVVAFGVLKLYVAAASANAADAHQLSVLASLLHSSSITESVSFNVAAMFFSVGTIVFFYLFRRTNDIPRVLSAAGLIGSALVPIVCVASLLFPQARVLQVGWVPIGLAEIAVGFWLLIKGVES